MQVHLKGDVLHAMIHSCSCSERPSSAIRLSRNRKCLKSCKHCPGSAGELSSLSESVPTGLKLSMAVDPNLSWKVASNCSRRRAVRRAKASVSRLNDFVSAKKEGKNSTNKGKQRMEDIPVYESEKLGVRILGRRFSDSPEVGRVNNSPEGEAHISQEAKCDIGSVFDRVRTDNNIIKEEINEVLYDNVDLSAMSILADVACNSHIIDELSDVEVSVYNAGTSKVDDHSDDPRSAEFHALTRMMEEQDVTNVQHFACKNENGTIAFPSERLHVLLSDKSARDDKRASSKEKHKEGSRTEFSFCRDRLNWDLNTPMDDWDNDCNEANTASDSHALHIVPGTNNETLDFVESCSGKIVFEDNGDSRAFEAVNTRISTSYAKSNHHLENSGVSSVPYYLDEKNTSHIQHTNSSSTHADEKLLRDSLTNVCIVAKKIDISEYHDNSAFLSTAKPDEENISKNQSQEYLNTPNIDAHSCKPSRNGDDGTSSEIGQRGLLDRASAECTENSGTDSDSLSYHHALQYEDFTNQSVLRGFLTNASVDSKIFDPNGSHDNSVSSYAADPDNISTSKTQFQEYRNTNHTDRRSCEPSRNGDDGGSSEIGRSGPLDRSSVECTDKFGADTGFLLSDHHALTSEELTSHCIVLSPRNADAELLIDPLINVSIDAKKIDQNGSHDNNVSLFTDNSDDANMSKNQLQEYCNTHNADGHSCEPSRNRPVGLSSEAGQSGPSVCRSVECTEKFGASTGSLPSDCHASKSEDLIDHVCLSSRNAYVAVHDSSGADVYVTDEVFPMATSETFDVSSKISASAVGPSSCADVSLSDQHVTVPKRRDDAECKSGSYPLFSSHVDVNQPIGVGRVELEEDGYQYEDGECCELLTYKWEDELKTEYVDNDSDSRDIVAIETAFDLHSSSSLNPNNLESKNGNQLVTASIYTDRKQLFHNVSKELDSHAHSILKTSYATHGPDTVLEGKKSDNHVLRDYGRHSRANGRQKLYDSRKGDAECGVNEMDSYHLANLRMKSSGWDQQLPDSYRRSSERSAESLGWDARTPGRRVLSSRTEGSKSPVTSCRNDRSYARASRLQEYNGLYPEDERNDHVSASFGRDGNTIPGRHRIKSDPWSDISGTHPPAHHCSSGHRVRDSFLEPGSKNAAEVTLAKLESSGFVVAPNGTIIKAAMSRRPENVCSRNIHLSTEQVSPAGKRDYGMAQSYENARQLSPDRNLDHRQGRIGGYGSRMTVHGHREQHRRTSRGVSRRDRSFSPQLRARSRSRSRSYSPYSWVSPRERNNGRMNDGAGLHRHNRSPLDFKPESRFERTRLTHQQPGFRERMERYSPPPRNRSSPPLRWLEERNKEYIRPLRSPIPPNSSRNHHFVTTNGQRRKEADDYYYPTHSARFLDDRCSRNDRSDDSRRGRSFNCKTINLLQQYDSSGDTKRFSYDEEDFRACNSESKISAGHEQRSPGCFVHNESKFGDLPRTDRDGEVHSKCVKADNSPRNIESRLPRIDGEAEFHFTCEGDKKSSGYVYNYKAFNPAHQHDTPVNLKHFSYNEEDCFGTCNGRTISSSEFEQRSPRGLDHDESQPDVRHQIAGEGKSA